MIFDTTVIHWLFSSLQQTPWVKIFDNNTLALCLGGLGLLQRLPYARGMTILGGRIRKLSQHSSNFFVTHPPLRVSPLIWWGCRTSLGVIKLVQPPHQLLIRSQCKDKIDTIWRIKVTSLESERSGSKTSGDPARAARMKYSTDSG
jgi:hypothetical protein